jgi:hypothetical protein
LWLVYLISLHFVKGQMPVAQCTLIRSVSSASCCGTDYKIPLCRVSHSCAVVHPAVLLSLPIHAEDITLTCFVVISSVQSFLATGVSLESLHLHSLHILSLIPVTRNSNAQEFHTKCKYNCPSLRSRSQRVTWRPRCNQNYQSSMSQVQ